MSMKEDSGTDQQVSPKVMALPTFSAGMKCHSSNDCSQQPHWKCTLLEHLTPQISCAQNVLAFTKLKKKSTLSLKRSFEEVLVFFFLFWLGELVGGSDRTQRRWLCKNLVLFCFGFFIKGFNEVHKGGFISQISDINPTQFPVFCSIKALIMPLT